jgi:hypothetical protein
MSKQPMSLHKKLSFIKSFIRILGYFAIYVAFPLNIEATLAALFLIVSEIVGIVEEVGEK